MARKAGSDQILIQDFNDGGLAGSKFSGVKNSLHKMIGWDPHSLPGVISVEQKMTKDSGATVTELCKARVNCSNGEQYWFSSTSGKVWARSAAGVWRLAYTADPDSALNESSQFDTGTAGTMDAIEYDGFVYWVTEKIMWRIRIVDAVDASWTDSSATGVYPINVMNREENLGNYDSNKYTLTTSINEGATHKKAITFTSDYIESIQVPVSSVDYGTGDWTITVHNENNVVVGTATTAIEDIGVDPEDAEAVSFQFTTPIKVSSSGTYHYHLTVDTGTSKVLSATTDDLADSYYNAYATCDSEYHPMVIQNLVLYIGDGKYIHQVDSGYDTTLAREHTFTRMALDLPEPHRVKCLGRYLTDILCGTVISNNVAKSAVFRWNTWSESFTNTDDVPEDGVNAFLKADNVTLVQAGKAGNIYWYDGAKLELYSKIPGEYSPSKYGEVYPNAVANNGGQVLFGFSNGSGNPADQLIYRYARHSRDYKLILEAPYPISERATDEFVLSGIEIGAILVVGTTVYASWKNGTSYGIDKLDASNKLDGAYFASKVMVVDRESKTNMAKIVVAYSSLPTNTDVEIFTDVNYAGYGSALSTRDDTDRAVIETVDESKNFNTMQVKFKATVSGNTAPQVESASVFIQ